MIVYNRKIRWYDKAFIWKYEKAIKTAVQKSAILVQREVRQSLSNVGDKAGLNKINKVEKWQMAENKKLGINRTVVEERRAAGEAAMGGTLKQFKTKNHKVQWGGTLKYMDKAGKLREAERIYWYAEPLHRWAQASVPGTPPNAQQGMRGGLKASITWEKFKDGMQAKVGPNYKLKYALAQEFGGRGLPERPYMRPAYEKTRFPIHMIFKKELWRAV